MVMEIIGQKNHLSSSPVMTQQQNSQSTEIQMIALAAGCLIGIQERGEVLQQKGFELVQQRLKETGFLDEVPSKDSSAAEKLAGKSCKLATLGTLTLGAIALICTAVAARSLYTSK